MGFVELENAGKKALEQYPALKRLIKRVYQLISCAVSPEKNKVDGAVARVSPDDDYEYFYGYYDKSPWDITDRYMICMKVKQTFKSVSPVETGIVGLIDTKNNNKFWKIGVTHAWNVQQGCMAQWMGPDFKSRIIYNDFRNGQYCSVIYNFENKVEEAELPLPVYDVAINGQFALTLDFSRLHRLRPGYGYHNLPEETSGEFCPDKPCIWKMDISTGGITPLFKYTDFAAFEHDKTMEDAEHKVNHIMISPNGERFMVLHRWFQKGRKHTRLVTANVDKSEMYNLSDDIFVSHCFWKDNQHILSFLRKKEGGNHYYLLKDKSQEYIMHWPRLETDGHCSYSSDKSLVVTDSYPNRRRLAFLYICKEKQEQPVRIAKVFAPFRYDNDCRCDLHPRWNRAGDMVCIDSVHEGKRGLYVIPITKKDIPVLPKERPIYQKGKYKIAYVITRCKNSGPMNQTLNIIRNLDREIFEPVLITIFLEDLGNSVIQQFLDIVPEFHCLKMEKVDSIIRGKQKLKVLLDDIKPNLIHALGMPPYTMALGYRNAVHLVTLRNYCYQDYPDKYGKKLGTVLAYKDMYVIKQQVNRGETFVTCAKSLSEIYRKKHQMDLGFIRNGVDVEKYEYTIGNKKREMRERIGLPNNKTIIACSGQFIDRKDQRFMIEGILASRHVEDLYMILMGDGPNFSGLQKQYGKDKRLLFTGNINNVNEYLQACDVYISTSKSEGMPNGVLEAMAVGLPVLLSNIPQHLEILEINRESGLSYELGNKDDFVEKFDMLITQNLIAMGKAASETVHKELSAEKMSRSYQELYVRLIQ